MEPGNFVIPHDKAAQFIIGAMTELQKQKPGFNFVKLVEALLPVVLPLLAGNVPAALAALVTALPLILAALTGA